MVVALEPPGVIHRHAGLPVAVAESGVGDVLLGGLGVSRVGFTIAGLDFFHIHLAVWSHPKQAVVVDDAGLEFEQFDELRGACFVHLGRPVPPEDDGGIAVVGQKFAHLRHGNLVDVFVHRAAGLRVGSASTVVDPIPRLGIIETELHAVLFAGFDKGLEEVFLVGRGLDVPITGGRGPEGKAVLMFRGDDDVFYARLLCQTHPGFGVVLGRIELLGKGFVFLGGHFPVNHDPLAKTIDRLAIVDASRNGEDAPVDEHPEAGITPPRHAGIALFLRLIRVGVRIRRGSRGRGRGGRFVLGKYGEGLGGDGSEYSKS